MILYIANKSAYFFLDQTISSRREEKTNLLVCAAFIMKNQPFILKKGAPGTSSIFKKE